ncbi:hypothetical protein TYRP_021539 [Tyrophagus putrescentiae]|nr:hypothetical protein TYRP_021539 [Tyrophagus putrescentiae]
MKCCSENDISADQCCEQVIRDKDPVAIIILAFGFLAFPATAFLAFGGFFLVTFLGFLVFSGFCHLEALPGEPVAPAVALVRPMVEDG